jgi:two-component system, LytTR family, sensor kinase
MSLRLYQPTRDFSIRRYRWLGLVVLVCIVAAMFFASLTFVMVQVFQKSRVAQAGMGVVFLWWLTRFLLWAALSPFVVLLVRRLPIEARPALRFAIHLAASLIFSFVHVCIQFTLFSFIAGTHNLFFNGFREALEEALNNYPFGVVAYWVVVAIVYASSYYERYGQEQIRASQLQAELAEAQLSALRMQLQPHFLFNALHSLNDLVITEPRAATRMIARLGDFLRMTLHSTGVQRVPLKRELEFLDAYLEIERIRFPDRLTVSVKANPAVLNAEVPNLLLQPLVENAVRHGFSSQVGAGRIEVTADARGEVLRIAVRDHGPGIQDRKSSFQRRGMGLAITQERLRHAYGGNCFFTVGNHAEGGALVICELPLRMYCGVPAGERKVINESPVEGVDCR